MLSYYASSNINDKYTHSTTFIRSRDYCYYTINMKNLNIRKTQGKQTSFLRRVLATLAIASALLVESHSECEKPKKEEISQEDGNHLLRPRRLLYPLTYGMDAPLRLNAEFLGIEGYGSAFGDPSLTDSIKLDLTSLGLSSRIGSLPSLRGLVIKVDYQRLKFKSAFQQDTTYTSEIDEHRVVPGMGYVFGVKKAKLYLGADIIWPVSTHWNLNRATLLSDENLGEGKRSGLRFGGRFALDYDNNLFSCAGSTDLILPKMCLAEIRIPWSLAENTGSLLDLSFYAYKPQVQRESPQPEFDYGLHRITKGNITIPLSSWFAVTGGIQLNERSDEETETTIPLGISIIADGLEIGGGGSINGGGIFWFNLSGFSPWEENAKIFFLANGSFSNGPGGSGISHHAYALGTREIVYPEHWHNISEGEGVAYDVLLNEIYAQRGFGRDSIVDNFIIIDNSGSGLVISTMGHFITACHVVGKEVHVKVFYRNRDYSGEVLACDTKNDVAFGIIDPPLSSEGIEPVVRFARSSDVQDEMPIELYGWQPGRYYFQKGIVADTHYSIGGNVPLSPNPEEIDNFILLNAAGGPGFSGGPVITEDGRVVGLTVRSDHISEETGKNLLAKPIDRVVEMIRKLLNKVQPHSP